MTLAWRKLGRWEKSRTKEGDEDEFEPSSSSFPGDQDSSGHRHGQPLGSPATCPLESERDHWLGELPVEPFYYYYYYLVMNKNKLRSLRKKKKKK